MLIMVAILAEFPIIFGFIGYFLKFPAKAFLVVFLIWIILFILSLIFLIFKVIRENRQRKTEKILSNDKSEFLENKDKLAQLDLKKLKEIGNLGEKIVSDKINEKLSSLKLKYWLYNDVYIKPYKHVFQIDHILVTPHKIYVLETKWHSYGTGIVYGHANGRQWMYKNYQSSHPIPNPIRQNNSHVKALMWLTNKLSKTEPELNFNEMDFKNVVILKEKEKVKIGDSDWNQTHSVVCVEDLIDKIISEYNNNFLSNKKITVFNQWILNEENYRILNMSQHKIDNNY